MIHSFLLIGQSNASGRGFKEDVAPIENDKILVLRNGRWRQMYVPVNADRETAGINLTESFADLYSREKGVEVGIIPCADGGTCLDQWVKGGLLFDHACYMSELASRTSTIAGVLWHQGESDCSEECYPKYEEKLTDIFDAFKERLNLYDVPFLMGGLGDYLKDSTRRAEFKNYIYINEALQHMAETNKMYGYVSAEGLMPNEDMLHFCAKSLREFGERYYHEFLKLEDKSKVFSEKPALDDAIKTDLEHL